MVVSELDRGAGAAVSGDDEESADRRIGADVRRDGGAAHGVFGEADEWGLEEAGDGDAAAGRDARVSDRGDDAAAGVSRDASPGAGGEYVSTCRRRAAG